MVNKRRTSVELLRIIAMILIIAHHFSVHGGFEYSSTSFSFNELWIQLISMGGKIGVNIFVLISGYYMSESDKSPVKRVIKLWLQVVFYSILIFFIFSLLKIQPFTVKELIKHCMPIIFSQWWFVTNYVVLCILSPYINVLIKSLTVRQYREMVVLCTVIWSIVPAITNMYLGCTSLVWFIYLYILAAYIRKNIMKISSKIAAFYACVTLAILVVTTIIFDIISIKKPKLYEQATRLYGMEMFPVLVISVGLFLVVLNLDMKNNKYINVISSTTFGIYLIHDDVWVKEWLWGTVIHQVSYAYSYYLVVYSVGSIMLVFAICMIIDLVRKALLQRIEAVLCDWITTSVNRLINRFQFIMISENEDIRD